LWGMDYDFVVLGGGSAGYAGARTAAALGLRTAVIDGSEELGGLCILRGCMPSKTVLESGNRYRSARRASEFGLRVEASGVDMGAIRERKRRMVGEFAAYRRSQLESGRFELIRGYGTFLDPHRIGVRLWAGGECEVRARTVLIATGSVVQWPSVPGLDPTTCWTSDDALEADHLPGSVAVLGGGAVALEFAHYFEALGSRVTVIQRSGHPLSDLDPRIGGAVREAFVKRGIAVHCGTRLVRIEAGAEGKRVVFEEGGAEGVLEAEVVLQALGREPAVRGLGLEAAGVALDRGGVACGPTRQTSMPHIFAAGDVCGAEEIVHVAVLHGESAARNARRLLAGNGEGLESAEVRPRLFAVFSDPEVAVAGLDARAATAAGVDFVEASYPFDDHGKSLVMAEGEGYVQLLAERCGGRLLGGVAVGPHASELIHEVVVALRAGMTAAGLAGVPHYHPTLSEIWTYPAEELAESEAAH